MEVPPATPRPSAADPSCAAPPGPVRPVLTGPVLSGPAVPVAEPSVDEETAGAVDGLAGADTPWQTVVWNDPVNLMSYVTWVLQKLFGYDKSKATALMLDVHHKGRATVSSGSREKVEGDVARLHAAGLWATMQRQS